VAVTGDKNQPLAASRDLEALQVRLREAEKTVETNVWENAAARFERYHLQSWDFGDLPERIEIPTKSGVPLLGYPALEVEGQDVSLKLYRNREDAMAVSQAGLRRLGELALQKELAWLQKDLRDLSKVKDLYITLGSGEELMETAYINIRNYLFDAPAIYPLTQGAFEKVVQQGRERLPGHLPKFIDQVGQLLRARQEILLHRKPYPGMIAELNQLLPKRFLEQAGWAQLQHVPRYLKAMLVRAERAAVNPVKDQERARQVVPYTQLWQKLSAAKAKQPAAMAKVGELRWLIEELKVSLFAQELGTATPISPKRLDRFLEENGLKM
jgi:ATP-dependent helicase HrpA